VGHATRPYPVAAGAAEPGGVDRLGRRAEAGERRPRGRARPRPHHATRPDGGGAGSGAV